MSGKASPVRILLLALFWLAFSLPAVAQTRSFTDDAGRVVELPERIERIMAAGPPAAVLLYVLAPEKMVGWVTAPSDEAKEFIAEPYRGLPAHGRLTGRGGTANIEAVLAMRPDIIVDVGTVDPTYASLADRVQEQTGIPYVLIEGRFADTAATLEKAGDLVGEAGRAQERAAYARAAFARLEEALAAVPENERPRVYYGRGPDGLETGLAGSINMEVLDAVGAENVAASAGTGGLANVSVEQVLAWNPDVILTLDPAFHASVRTDPLWAGIAAVAENRVYRAPVLPFGWFDTPPGVNRIMSAAWLAGVLYPGHVPLDLSAETRGFYRLFYHVELTDDQVDRLLSGAQKGP